MPKNTQGNAANQYGCGGMYDDMLHCVYLTMLGSDVHILPHVINNVNSMLAWPYIGGSSRSHIIDVKYRFTLTMMVGSTTADFLGAV